MTLPKTTEILLDDIAQWRKGWFLYSEKKLGKAGKQFEKNKDWVVDILMARRGGYQRPFLHFSVTLIIGVGILSAPILANSYPGRLPDALGDYTPSSAVISSLDTSDYGIETEVSKKPRDQVLVHKVQEGETLASIAERYGISIDTIKWDNDIKSDSLSINQELKIPPVTGIVHKVKDGETIYSIAKKYKTEAQKILNFPFNDFTDLDTFALASGQYLIVPDGVMPEAAPVLAPQYFQTPSVSQNLAGGSGQYSWPTNGIITQYPIWYHMALDIANPSQPPITAAGDGVVILVQYLQYGYGRHVLIDHGGGISTLYGHMIEIYVKPGDRVSRGQLIGKMGSTGRSTGTHLHFEVRRNGVTQNPLTYLK